MSKRHLRVLWKSGPATAAVGVLGPTATDIVEGTAAAVVIAENRGTSLAEMCAKTPREGAHCPLFLLFGEPEGSGHYYGSDAKRSPLDRYRAPGTPAYAGDWSRQDAVFTRAFSWRAP